MITTLSIITPIVGAGCLVAAIFRHRARLAHLKRSEVLEGVVIDLEEDRHDDTKLPYFSVILPDGSTESFKGKVASNPPRFEIGQRVKVFFSPESAPRFIVADRWELWLGIGIWYVAGTFGVLSPIPLSMFNYYLARSIAGIMT